MKKILPCFFLLFAACTEPAAPVAEKDTAPSPPAPIDTVPPAPPDTITFAVEGRILVATQYCSGHRPRPEVLEEAKKHKPRAGVKVFFRNGNTNSEKEPLIDSALTDAQGKYRARLRPGAYCLIIEEQALPPGFKASRYAHKAAVSSEDCYAKWWANCCSAFTLSSDTTLKNIRVDQNCMVSTLCPCIYNPDSRKLQ